MTDVGDRTDDDASSGGKDASSGRKDASSEGKDASSEGKDASSDGNGASSEAKQESSAPEVVQRIDRWQRRTPVLSFLAAVWKKYGDDEGGKLVALLTFSAFLSLFPMLLVLVTILGYALHGRPELQQRAIDSALSELPIIGDQLRQNVHGFGGNGLALIIGIAVAIWGGLGVVRASQDLLATVWMVPRRKRPGLVKRLLKSGIMLVVMFAALASSVALSAALTGWGDVGLLGRIAVLALVTLLNFGWFTLGFRVLVPAEPPWRDVMPGAAVAAVGWQALLLVGATLVQHNLRGATQSYGFFGIVLGLVAWLSLLSTVLVLAAEVNAVKAFGLWPRSVVTPGLTQPDREALEATAKVEERAPNERVDVDFSHPPASEDEDARTAR